MSKLQVSLAISDYDHDRDFVYGRATAEGLDINFQVLPTPEIFDRATRDQEWDVALRHRRAEVRALQRPALRDERERVHRQLT